MIAGQERKEAAVADPVEQACPINPVVDLVFSRWTTPILWVLEHHGRLRFNELQRHLPTITPKVLTQRLRQLERDGLVIRTYHAEIPPRVEYEISGLGRTLSPLFRAITDWSEAHLPAVSAARRAYDAAREAEEAWAEG
ncbi:helix-turn-helix transcriptional regulator [Streptomyces piniterrae]|uniref:Helix-turn-helix transcriptional regulator n=1 Tax=Streptomyces piniterrae TaxID=2571125 RepID=A0A4U0P3M7_9ACTN|nr:helix-turn-helix domain-containing protein [Streptomyces piniterrae]TJZ57264.1 helix-turn-helix transcriptional regulator [Streptomyces piniterrae]